MQSVVFGPSTVFNAPLKAQRRHSLCMIPVNTEPGLRILLKWRVQIFLNVPHNSLCIAPHSSCRQSHRSHLRMPFRCLLSEPPPSHLAILYAALAVNQVLNGRFSQCVVSFEMRRPLASNTHELGLRGFGVYSSFSDCRRVGALDCLLIVCPSTRGNLSAQLHSPDCVDVYSSACWPKTEER